MKRKKSSKRRKTLSRLSQRKRKKKISYRTLVCSPRGNRISMTVPMSGDPIPVIHKKVDHISETTLHTGDQLEDVYDVLALIEAIDSPPIPSDCN